MIKKIFVFAFVLAGILLFSHFAKAESVIELKFSGTTMCFPMSPSGSPEISFISLRVDGVMQKDSSFSVFLSNPGTVESSKQGCSEGKIKTTISNRTYNVIFNSSVFKSSGEHSVIGTLGIGRPGSFYRLSGSLLNYYGFGTNENINGIMCQNMSGDPFVCECGDPLRFWCVPQIDGSFDCSLGPGGSCHELTLMDVGTLAAEKKFGSALFISSMDNNAILVPADFSLNRDGVNFKNFKETTLYSLFDIPFGSYDIPISGIVEELGWDLNTNLRNGSILSGELKFSNNILSLYLKWNKVNTKIVNINSKLTKNSCDDKVNTSEVLNLPVDIYTRGGGVDIEKQKDPELAASVLTPGNALLYPGDYSSKLGESAKYLQCEPKDFSVDQKTNDFSVYVKKEMHLDAYIYSGKSCGEGELVSFEKSDADKINLTMTFPDNSDHYLHLGSYNLPSDSGTYKIKGDPLWFLDNEEMSKKYKFCSFEQNPAQFNSQDSAIHTLVARYVSLGSEDLSKKDSLALDVVSYKGNNCSGAVEGVSSSVINDIEMDVSDAGNVLKEKSPLSIKKYELNPAPRPAEIKNNKIFWKSGGSSQYEICSYPAQSVSFDGEKAETKTLTGYLRKKNNTSDFSCAVNAGDVVVGGSLAILTEIFNGAPAFKYSFDVDGDGIFEKEDSPSSIYQTTYKTTGEKIIKVKVVDSKNNQANCEKKIKVTEPGEGSACQIKSNPLAVNGILNIESGTVVTFSDDISGLDGLPCKEFIESGESGLSGDKDFPDCSNNLFVHTYKNDGDYLANSYIRVGGNKRECGKIIIKVSEAEPECFIETDKTKTTAGIPVKITWSTKNAKSCTLKKIVGGKESYINIKGQISGNINEKPFESSRYVLECKNVTKECTATKDVTVGFINIIKEINPYF